MSDEMKNEVVDFEKAKSELTDERKPSFKDRVIAAGTWVLNLRIRDLLVPVVVVGGAVVIAGGIIGSALQQPKEEKTTDETSEPIDVSYESVD